VVAQSTVASSSRQNSVQQLSLCFNSRALQRCFMSRLYKYTFAKSQRVCFTVTCKRVERCRVRYCTARGFMSVCLSPSNQGTLYLGEISLRLPNLRFLTY